MKYANSTYICYHIYTSNCKKINMIQKCFYFSCKIKNVLENELNRKIVVNIKFDLKSLMSESATPRTSLPEPNIYKP